MVCPDGLKYDPISNGCTRTSIQGKLPIATAAGFSPLAGRTLSMALETAGIDTNQPVYRIAADFLKWYQNLSSAESAALKLTPADRALLNGGSDAALDIEMFLTEAGIGIADTAVMPPVVVNPCLNPATAALLGPNVCPPNVRRQ